MHPSHEADPTTSLLLVRGGNDIASAVAHRLFTAGHPVIILEASRPLTVRRGMAYASAVYEGRVTLQGVTAEHVPTIEQALALLMSRQAIPVLAGDDGRVLTELQPAVIVDARLRKKERSGSRITDAPLVIGLGPGFAAGVEAHLVIETNRGPNLGRIITEGEAEPYTGEPVEIAGHSKDRYLYAPRGGAFRTTLDLGQQVEAGQVVGNVEGELLTARVGGIIRGIVKDGLLVQAGAKLVDIDPRGDARYLSELSQKAWTIADAVLTAIHQSRMTADQIPPFPPFTKGGGEGISPS
ncbi:MAG TPA: selenium-dependent molybdenum cofactor biosynthesis protein YqeB [Candidatus Methylomirabilis sp.]|nr:selenium-dependent molybdenum cofactor biosynthesis protein YqeB [Candidatus Methylomirabilis sp.]